MLKSGFRQGKVPLNIIKDRYSKNVLPEVTDTINKNLNKAIKKKLKPAVQPKLTSINMKKVVT